MSYQIPPFVLDQLTPDSVWWLEALLENQHDCLWTELGNGRYRVECSDDEVYDSETETWAYCPWCGERINRYTKERQDEYAYQVHINEMIDARRGK